MAFAGVMAVVLSATGLFLFLHLRADVDGTLDRQLRSRARELTALVQQADTGLRDAGSTTTGAHGGDVAQILDTRGRVFDAPPSLRRLPLLTRADLRAARRGTLLVDHRRAPVLGDPTRLLATPVYAQDQRLLVVVGASLRTRDQALADLKVLLLIGGAGALLLASLAGYALAAAALRPVEAMRRRAASISSDELHQRLPLGSSHDELHRLGLTLNEMLARLQTGLARERAFTADASHELRTPLTMLKTELELIARDEPRGADLQAAVGAAVVEADQLAHLIDDLLLLARADADSLPLTREDVDVRELLEAVADGVLAAGGPSAVSVDAPPDLAVLADRAALARALRNLVDNALRHGAPPVHLSARRAGAAVELHVTDAGPGFPRGFAPRAFERFARGDTARGVGGAGLGLAIVEATARAHGGSAGAGAAEGRGADVWLTIPAAPPPRHGAGRRAVTMGA